MKRRDFLKFAAAGVVVASTSHLKLLGKQNTIQTYAGIRLLEAESKFVVGVKNADFTDYEKNYRIFQQGAVNLYRSTLSEETPKTSEQLLLAFSFYQHYLFIKNKASWTGEDISSLISFLENKKVDCNISVILFADFLVGIGVAPERIFQVDMYANHDIAGHTLLHIDNLYLETYMFQKNGNLQVMYYTPELMKKKYTSYTDEIPWSNASRIEVAYMQGAIFARIKEYQNRSKQDLNALGDYKRRATTYFTRALEENDNDARSHYFLGSIISSDFELEAYLQDISEPAKRAISEFQKSLDIYPKQSDSWVSMANIYRYLHDYERSIECLKHGIEFATEKQAIELKKRLNLLEKMPKKKTELKVK